jgi:transposase, IS5 family
MPEAGMLRDRYEPQNLFELVAALSLKMEPVLARLDELLADDVLFGEVRADLAQRYPHTQQTGRPSTPVEVILRMIIVKHLYGWSYDETEYNVSDSLVLRQFCRVYLNSVPDDTTLIKWANLIQPHTLHELLDHVTELARSLKVTRGRKLRTDGTVVETNIHHPTDSTLLGDAVRVLSRTLRKARKVLTDPAALSPAHFRDRTRSARRQVKRIMEAARRRGEAAADQLQAAYRQLLATARASQRQAQRVAQALKQQADDQATRLADQLHTVLPRVARVIDQTVRRVLGGEKVPATEKLVSLFEPETALISKGKPAHPTEFGRVLWLDEVEGGIVSGYRILDGNPSEQEQLRPSLDHHIEVFDHPPDVLTADRGLYSADNERYAQSRGVKQVVLPKPGARSAERIAYEKQPWFRRGRRWRAGIEGRISGLKRGQKLERCLYHGTTGMERWVGWGLIAHDLRMIARTTAC